MLVRNPAHPRHVAARRAPGDRVPTVDRPSTRPGGLAGTHPRAGRRGPAGPTEESGFTLVELLVVVLVLGTLTAVAVPTFIGQRESAWDAAVTAELRAASIALESYRAQNGEYSTDALATGAGWGYEPSGNLELRPPDVTATSYCLIAQHVSTEAPNANTTWRVRDDAPVERIETGAGDCSSPALAD